MRRSLKLHKQVAGLPGSRVEWSARFADVQTLNEMVRRSELDVAKVGCGVAPSIARDYEVLSGGAGGLVEVR